MTNIYEEVLKPNPNDDILAQIEMGTFGHDDSEGDNDELNDSNMSLS